MKRLMFSTATAALATIGIVLLTPGCNDDGGNPTGDEFRVTPSSAELSRDGDALVLQAVGGLEPLEWTLSDTNTAMGTLSGSGRTVTYTRGARNGANVVQVTDSRTWTASATIIQTTDSTTGTSSLAVSPTTATLSENRDTAVFIANAGSGAYTWTIADARLGHLSSREGKQVVYTRDRPGNNTLTLRDSSGQSTTVNIAQPAVAPLAVSPASASVSTNAGTQVFTVSGGTGTYTWSFAPPAHGTMVPPAPAAGSSIVYVSNVGDTAGDVIQVTDGVSTAFATVTKH